MKSSFIALCLLFVFGVITSAQQPSDPGTGEIKRSEFYVGYSNQQSDNGFQSSDSLNGFEVAGVYNLKRYIGIKADFSASFNQNRVSLSGTLGEQFSFKQRNSVYNLLGGIQIKDNAKKGRFKPFGHVLAGAGFTGSSNSDFQCSPVQTCPFFQVKDNRNGFAAALGGGLDVRVNKRIQIRVIQVDYNPIRTSGSGTQNNVRFGAGIVF